jgi:hypothetical protein
MKVANEPKVEKVISEVIKVGKSSSIGETKSQTDQILSGFAR